MTKLKFRKRFICFIMIHVMFFTQTGIADVLAAGIIEIAESGNLREAGNDGNKHQIVDFEPLEEEIREQKVLPGTAIDELVLPDKLTVYLSVMQGEPTGTPTEEPGNTPAVAPTDAPTEEPGNTPAVAPIGTPTEEPGNTPAVAPPACLRRSRAVRLR